VAVRFGCNDSILLPWTDAIEKLAWGGIVIVARMPVNASLGLPSNNPTAAFDKRG
jgi:hypothetical protein